MATKLNFLTWLATAQSVYDLGHELNEETMKGVPGIIFSDLSYIQIHTDDDLRTVKFWTISSCEEMFSDKFIEVAEFLWISHARYNND